MTGLILVLLAMVVSMGLYHRYKPLPKAVAMESEWFEPGETRFLVDHRYVDARGRSRSRRELIPAMLGLIQGARERLVMDMFLFNPDGADPARHLPVTETITRALIERRRQCPRLRVTVLVDPINSYYGAHWPDHLRRLQAAGVEVLETPLARLRDSNPTWSVFWRLLVKPWCQRPHRGWLANPIGPWPVTLRSWLTLLNFRANHRKVMVADRGEGWQGLISSGNPHDASSAHSNVGLLVSGDPARALLDQEQALLNWAKGYGTDFNAPLAPGWRPPGDGPALRLLTESRLRAASLALINNAEPGDELDLALFYLSHRRVIKALKRAHARGCRLRVLLDPNKDAFGRVKGGMPNRQVALELQARGIPVRWYRTHGEQFHCKLLRLERRDGRVGLILGSANLTRRNLDDLNLEAGCELRGNEELPALRAAGDWFERCWSNPPGFQCSVPYSVWADRRRRRYLLYRIVEFTGWSSF
ncbi:phospholipase D-like domain-containing protein [Halomonadaceae bacterium KBTZ08]